MSFTILCVEDNPQNMRLVRKILQHAGYSVLEAVDGLSAIDITESAQPSLILMDVNLPDIDGLEATRRIKSTPHLAHIPIVALTANAMYGDRERCLDAGCDDYLSKPVNKAQLLEIIDHFLAKAQAVH